MTEKQKKALEREGVFKPGRAGCESRLYEVRGFHPGSLNVAEWIKLDEEERREKCDVLRIAANDVHEVLKYVQRWEEDFDVREIVLVGLMILLSGSPHH